MIFNTINETRFDKIMSAFSQLLGKYIREKDIQVFDLVNYCCIDRSTMYKMINGKRNPPSEDVFEKIAEFLCLSPQEYRKFKDAYQITVLGEKIYFRRKSVTEFLLNFPDCFSIAFPSQVTTDDSRVQPQNIENPEIIQKFTNALQKGMDYVQSHTPEEIAEVIAPQFKETDIDTITTIVKRYYDQDTWKENLIFKKDSFELLQDILEDAGELGERAEYEELVQTEYAKNAVKEK